MNNLLACWCICILFTLAGLALYRRWAHTGHPQLLFAGRVFLAIAAAVALACILL